MGEHARDKAGAPAPKAGAPTPAPDPKGSEPTWEEHLSRGHANATWLRQTIVPGLQRLAAGEPQDGSALDLAAYEGLATIKDALDRTSIIMQMGPDLRKSVGAERLVEYRRLLQVAHDELRPTIERLTKLVHARPPVARPKPAPPVQLEAPGGAPKQKPKPLKGRQVAFTKHVAGPPSIDFGKIAPNKTETLSVPIFNLVPQVATAAVYYDGSSAILLRGSPTSLYPAGYKIPDGAQHVMLQFDAPAARGAHRGSVRIDLSWPKGIKPETLTIPVVAHSALAHEATDDEIKADVARQQRERAEDAARAKKVKQADDELAAFDRAHPGFTHNGFEDKFKSVALAMTRVSKQQNDGILRASEEIMAYVKAPPPTAKPHVLFDLAMVVLDIASAGVANVVAKRLERNLLKAVPTDPKKVAKWVSLSESTAIGVSDAVKEGLKIASKRARPTPDANSKPNKPGGTIQSEDLSDDPRSAFLQIVRTTNNEHDYNRGEGLVRSAALLRPTLFKNPDVAVQALEAIRQSLDAETDRAFNTYYETTIHQWFGFISELKLGAHRVGSVDGEEIAPVRGVVDIGFQAGRSPRDPVIAKSAIMRGVSNAAVKTLRERPLLDVGVPIRLYGLPSPNHAELLVSVTRAPDRSTVQYLDQTNGSAPGPGQWLKARGHGDPKKGAESLLKELLSRSLQEQKIVLTTDQDPAEEARRR